MKSLMPPEAYTSQNWFQLEQERIFKTLWQFIAPKMLLSRNNAFVRRRIAGIDIVVQNMDGVVRAFENVCLHRLSPIQNEDQGVRVLACPYHGWRYGSEGEVANIPSHDECYRFSKEQKSALRLRQFQVYEYGQLIFVNLHEKPIAFGQQFNYDSIQSLKDASEIFDSEVLVTCFKCNFNWKLAYENLRDSLHPQFLHAKSLYNIVKFQTVINENELNKINNYQRAGSNDNHSHFEWLRTFSGGGLNEPIDQLPHYHWHNYVNRYGNDDWYLNWLMYPNLHIASGSGGFSFIIEHHIPTSAATTDLWIYYVTGKKKRKYPTSPAVLLAHLEGAEKVLSEDILILEKVQTELGTHSLSANTGDFEASNMAIEKWYIDQLKGLYFG